MDMILAANGNISVACGHSWWISIDSGLSFALAQATPNYVYCLARDSTDVLYAGVNDFGVGGDIWTSIDNGATWAFLCNVGPEILDIEVSNGGTLCVIDSTTLAYGYSTDNGATWNWTVPNFYFVLFRIQDGTLRRTNIFGDVDTSIDGIAWVAFAPGLCANSQWMAESPSGAFFVNCDLSAITRYFGGAWTTVLDLAPTGETVGRICAEGGPSWE
jgi:hypothetical protein